MINLSLSVQGTTTTPRLRLMYGTRAVLDVRLNFERFPGFASPAEAEVAVTVDLRDVETRGYDPSTERFNLRCLGFRLPREVTEALATLDDEDRAEAEWLAEDYALWGVSTWLLGELGEPAASAVAE